MGMTRTLEDFGNKDWKVNSEAMNPKGKIIFIRDKW
jgi:hypothetical protein